MHSRIFEISVMPIAKEDRVIADYFNDSGFVGRHADYTLDVDDDERKDSLDWLQRVFDDGLVIDAEHDTVTVADRSKCLFNDWDKFREWADRLSSVTLDDFCADRILGDSPSFMLYMLKTYFEGDGFFVLFDGDEHHINDWLRMAEEGRTYHLGAVIDYHD